MVRRPRLTRFEPVGKAVFYQKHMSHHLLPDIDREWLDALSHAFLIREPRRVILSFSRIAGEPSLEATGLPQQLEIFTRTRERTGTTPPVVDARDLLERPERMLSALCAALGLDFDAGMLAWPPGPRDTDGVWARYWYDTVWQSTGFHSYEPDDEPVPRHLSGLLEAADEIYRELHQQRLQP